MLQRTVLSESVVVINFHATSLTCLGCVLIMVLIMSHKATTIEVIMGLTQKLMKLSRRDNFITIYGSTVVQLQSNQLL